MEGVYIRDLTKTKTLKRTINGNLNEEKIIRYFTSLIFNISKEQMDKIILSDQLHLSLGFLSGTSFIKGDLEEFNMNIVHEFGEALSQLP